MSVEPRGPDGFSIFVGFMLGVVILFLVLGLCGVYDVRKEMQIEAVKRGAAHWKVSDEGRTTFKWNAEAPPQQEAK